MGHPHAHFGHHHHEHAHAGSAKTQSMMRWATYASVAMALTLLIAKTAAWWSTESLSMLSSLTDSLFDLVSSIVNLVALRYALKPADEDHRFGHTSIEDIAGLGQFAFIAASMAIIVLQSVERLFNPHPLANESIGIWVSVVALLLTTGLVIYQTMVTRRSKSIIIASDRLHYAGDMLFNLGVLIALGASKLWSIVWADPAMAIIIAIVVLYSTREIGVRAFNNLMDREMPDDEKKKIMDILASMPEVLSCHNMKTRYSGTKAFIQMHADIDNRLDFMSAHAITEKLEEALLAAFPGAEVIIHPDPVPPGGRTKPHSHVA